jgi:hypothetical protein
MMRAGSGIVAALIALMVSACGSSTPPTSAPDLFLEYAESTNVKNDKFDSGGTSEDRLANFAAYYTPEQLKSKVLSASPCDADAGCHLNGAVGKAAQDFAGPAATVFERSILVKHQNGSLELITLYVARKSDSTAELIDSTGKAYSGGLDDFRQNNDLLSSDDLILTPRNITSTPGEGKIVTVSGHTASNWQPWLIGGIVAVIVLGAGLVVTRRLVTRRRGSDVG